MKPMSTADARRARGIGRRLTDARRSGDRDKELRYHNSAKAMIAEFGSNARREIEAGRREQLRRTRG